jgi:hypothetical protein
MFKITTKIANNKTHLLRALASIVAFFILGILTFTSFQSLMAYELEPVTHVILIASIFGFVYFTSFYLLTIKNKINLLNLESYPKKKSKRGLFIVGFIMFSMSLIFGLSIFATGKVFYFEGLINSIKFSFLPPLILIYLQAGMVFFYSKNPEKLNEDLRKFHFVTNILYSANIKNQNKNFS